jgi:4-hydroxyphenylpyruvate dioxygenase
MAALASPAPRARPAGPTPALSGFDHIEWWVGNARQAAHFFASGFGFRIVAHAGPDTGVRDRESYALTQGDIWFVVTNALSGDSDIAQHVARHGDGVRSVAYRVADADETHRRVAARGGFSVSAPQRRADAHGHVVLATIAAYSDTVHTLVERDEYHGAFLPGYEPVDSLDDARPPVGLVHLDHVVANVPEGELAAWVDWYERVWGLHPLQHFSEDAIATEYSALRSTVVSDGAGVVQPINEPARGRRKSQIAEYLEYYAGAGVQHLALRTDDIVTTVRRLRERGIRLLGVPATYYDDAQRRMAGIGAELPWKELAELGILVDRDEQGYLLQVFTESIAGRPTVFCEIIQREGARGFGEGNFKALFESIEAEQARRGNL